MQRVEIVRLVVERAVGIDIPEDDLPREVAHELRRLYRYARRVHEDLLIVDVGIGAACGRCVS